MDSEPSPASPADSPADTFNQLLDLLAAAEQETGDDRRRHDRFPICCRMRVTPSTPDGRSTSDDIGVVAGRDLSSTGISFSHDIELTCTHLVLELSIENLAYFRLLAEVLWSHQSPLGLYETGCRLLRKLDWQLRPAAAALIV
ncbi:MAG: PilZ domain-containing protein [Pirellulales bacterium]